jgi:hypothetical protein
VCIAFAILTLVATLLLVAFHGRGSRGRYTAEPRLECTLDVISGHEVSLRLRNVGTEPVVLEESQLYPLQHEQFLTVYLNDKVQEFQGVYLNTGTGPFGRSPDVTILPGQAVTITLNLTRSHGIRIERPYRFVYESVIRPKGWHSFVTLRALCEATGRP